MPPAFATLVRLPGIAFGDRRRPAWAVLAALHLAAAAILVATEADPISQGAFLLTWGLSNFAGLLLLRRPVAVAALSLTLLVVLVLLSRLKYQTLFMTVSFVDLMIV